MKRIATKLIISLLLVSGGAVVNVAVAWGCAALVGVDGNQMFPEANENGRDFWQRYIGDSEGLSLTVFRRRTIGVTDNTTTIIPLGSLPLLGVRSSGWPKRSMEGARWSSDQHGLTFKDSMPLRPTVYAPLRPIFRGFLINTLFYALVLWALWSAPFATRRLIRKRRGRCVKCAYDLTGAEHDACPECGGES